MQQGAATISIRTEVKTTRKAQNVRVISTILDPSGKEVGRPHAPALDSDWEERTYEQQVAASARCGHWKSGISTSW